MIRLHNWIGWSVFVVVFAIVCWLFSGADDRWKDRQAQYSDSGASCSWEQGTRYDGGSDGRQPSGNGQWEVVCK